MSQDISGNEPDGVAPFVPPGRSRGGADMEPGGLDHLPPPAFPSGPDRGARASADPPSTGGEDAAGAVATEESGFPEDAFIDPDEPIAPGDDPFSDDAFIDPDEPIVRTRPPEKPADFEEVVRGRNEDGEEDVIVTGIGDDRHLEEIEELASAGRYDDPDVAELVQMVGTLADALRDRGEAGLRTTPEMTRFEATLRGYCVGYLAGVRRDGD